MGTHFLGAPFDFAQDMLCAFARVTPILVAAMPRSAQITYF
jgi:hypothetical protein